MIDLRSHLDDVHVYGGLLLLSVGAGWVYRPAGLIVAGVGLLALGVWALVPRPGRPE